MNGFYFDEKQYEEYLKELVDIYQNSTDLDSIVVEFILNEKECNTTIKRIHENGFQEILSAKKFYFNEEAKQNFFLKAIKTYIKYNEIFTTNIVSDSKDSTKNTVRIVTQKNDLFNMYGLSIELANELLDEINVINEKKKQEIDNYQKDLPLPNEAGIGNTTIIILTSVVIGFALLGTIIFMLLSR